MVSKNPSFVTRGEARPLLIHEGARDTVVARPDKSFLGTGGAAFPFLLTRLRVGIGFTNLANGTISTERQTKRACKIMVLSAHLSTHCSQRETQKGKR